MDMINILAEATKEYKINLTSQQLLQFEKYFNMLVEWNGKINLTAITDAEGVAVKHFADSLALLNYVDVSEGASVIDVGTGAGFPGVALKIARPDIRLTLLDSLKKRLNFLDEVTNELGLSAVIVHSRAEDGAKNKDLRENFDFAVARAVAQLNILAEYCLPYVKTGGNFVAMKGPRAWQEIEKAQSAFNLLGGRVKNTFEFSLPMEGGERTIAVIEKYEGTPPKYPRNSGKIKSKPL